MSEPRLDWICMLSSGPIKIRRPSIWEAKVTPSSRIFPSAGQRKDLEPAAVGENGAVPPHKTVKAPNCLHQGIAWTQVQVVGIGQLNLAANFHP